MSKRALVVGVGAERGIGGQLCLRLAAEGLHVFVAGRTQQKIDSLVATITARGGKASTLVVDTTSEAQVVAMFEQIGNELDLVIYNAGNNTSGRIIDMAADYFENSWRVVCFGGFLVGREALRRMVPNKRGTIVFTGASASWRGRANFGAFNSSKGALRNLAQAMAKEYASDGIHVAHVVVDGGVHGERLLARRPDVIDRVGEDGLISIEGIVDAFVFLYRQPPRAWTFELDLRTYKENW